MKYKKKPFIIDAEQFNGEIIKGVHYHKNCGQRDCGICRISGFEDETFYIEEDDEIIPLEKGDWVLHLGNRLSWMTDERFKMEYEQV